MYSFKLTFILIAFILSQVNCDSPSQLRQQVFQNFNNPEITNQFTLIVANLRSDSNGRSAIGQFLAIINMDSTFNDILDHLAQNGFPALANMRKIDLIASALNFIESTTPIDDPDVEREIQNMAHIIKSHVEFSAILKAIDSNEFRNLIKYFGSQSEAFDRLKTEPSAEYLLPLTLRALGFIDLDLQFDPKLFPLLEKMLPSIGAILLKNDQSMRLTWMYNADSGAVYLIDCNSKNSRVDLYPMQFLKLYRDLKSSGHDPDDIGMGVLFQNLQDLKNLDEIFEIRGQFMALPSRAIPLPGNKPPRPFPEIERQVSDLNQHKKLVDKMKELSQLLAPSLGPNYFGNFAIPYNKFFYEAQNLQAEVKFSGQKVNDLDLMISHLVSIGAVMDDSTNLKVALTQLIDLDYDGLIEMLPRILNLMSKLKFYLDTKKSLALPALAALLNVDVTVDNILNYLGHNGYPGILKESKIQIILNILESIPPLEDKKEITGLEIEEMMEQLIDLIDSQNILRKYFNLPDTSIAFYNFLQFLERPEIRKGYQRFLRNFDHFMDPILYPFVGLETNRPSNFGALLRTFEQLLHWERTTQDVNEPNECFQFDPTSNVVDLVQVEGQQVDVYRSIFLKLQLDLQSVIKDNVKVKTREFIDHVTSLVEIGGLENILKNLVTAQNDRDFKTEL